MPDESGDFLDQMLRLRLHGMSRDIGPGDDFVDVGAFVGSRARKPSREGVIGNIRAELVPCQANDRAGIETTGQTRSQRHVAAKPQADAVGQEIAEPCRCFSQIERRRTRIGLQCPVPGNLEFQTFDVENQFFAGKQLLDPGKSRVSLVIETIGAPDQKPQRSTDVRAVVHIVEGEQGFVFRGKGEKIRCRRKQKRLLAKSVAGAHKAPPVRVIEREGKHAVQLGQKVFSPRAVCGQ